MERFIRFFAGAQNDRETGCVQGMLDIRCRTGIASALVMEKVEMCADGMPLIG